MDITSLKKDIEQDLNRWGTDSFLKAVLFKREFRLVYRYRICSYLKSKRVLFPIYQIERILYHGLCNKCGCDIPSHVQIGSGFQILHSWGIVINSQTVIGENCTILTGTVIGKTHKGVPCIGNNVYIGARSIILGNITIGNNVVIGAGATVTHDVPEGAVVKGPAATCC